MKNNRNKKWPNMMRTMRDNKMSNNMILNNNLSEILNRRKILLENLKRRKNNKKFKELLKY